MHTENEKVGRPSVDAEIMKRIEEVSAELDKPLTNRGFLLGCATLAETMRFVSFRRLRPFRPEGMAKHSFKLEEHIHRGLARWRRRVNTAEKPPATGVAANFTENCWQKLMPHD